MERKYSIQIQTDSLKFSFLENGYIKCDVFLTNYPFVRRSFLYCLHCSTLGASSWFFEHKKKEVFDPSPEMISTFRAKLHRFIDDIHSEVDLLYETGSLFPRQLPPQIPMAEKVTPDKETTPTNQNSTTRFPQTTPTVVLPQQRSNDDQGGGFEERLRSFSVQDICDCFSQLCFDTPQFDPNPFCFLSRIVFGADGSDVSESEDSVARSKGKIISTLLRKVFVKLSLTKSQMDSLNRFIKAILVFLSPTNLNVANRVHAGYLSCLREATKREEEARLLAEQSFHSCRFFSLAFDTALFGQEHVLSCIVRFTFEERMTQFPLFLCVCFATTGEELAKCVFQKLKEINTPFHKLSSISTDGGSNMIGRTNGMVSQLRRLIQSEYGSRSGNFHQIWCLCHRLNLVIRDFQNVEHIKTVFEFCDWFATKRKAVVYRKWLKQKHSDDSLPKIPTPSETRWSFYKDVIQAVLVQTGQIEEFLANDSEIGSFRNKFGQSQTLMVTTAAFFQNDFILAHFLFARFVLRKICAVNQKMEEEFTMLPFAWVLLNGLKKELSQNLDEIRARNFGNFDFLETIESEKIISFENVLQRCLLGLETRFPCPSMSLDTRVSKDHLSPSLLSINHDYLKTVRGSCPLFELVGLFLFPDDLIRRRQINPAFLGPKYPEVRRVSCKIIEREREIRMRKHNSSGSEQNEEYTQEPITLLDVFEEIGRDDYPELWNVVLQLLSLMPTSVGCEQSFSVLKHKLHTNMKKETAIIFMQNHQKLDEFKFI